MLSLQLHDFARVFSCDSLALASTKHRGDAENARLENAGLENSGTGNVWNATCGIT